MLISKHDAVARILWCFGYLGPSHMIILRAWGGEKDQMDCGFPSAHQNYMNVEKEQFLQRKSGCYYQKNED